MIEKIEVGGGPQGRILIDKDQLEVYRAKGYRTIEELVAEAKKASKATADAVAKAKKAKQQLADPEE